MKLFDKIKKKDERTLKIDGMKFYLKDLKHQFNPYVKKPRQVLALKIEHEFEVETLEGTMKGNKGDFLIIGVKGELYPCKPDIFHETYDEMKPIDNRRFKRLRRSPKWKPQPS